MPQMVIGQMNMPGSAGARNYFATTDNGNIAYQFAGDTLDEQAGNLQMLAVYMNSGENAVIANIGNVLELGDVTIDDAVGQLFEANDELAYLGAVGDVFEAVDATLWEEIVEAGVWLLGLL